ncbi:MAG: protein kinase [Blastocatellia bacterium]|nr:protein kinase [Blastocatellia bacterium]
MNAEQYLRAKAIFLAACERPTAELPAFLEAECGDDLDVRDEVESLLAFRDDTANTVQSENRPRDTVRLAGRYALGAVIGRGGMGRVYEAVDERFARKVAVKELSVEGDIYANAFAHEARLLNGLRHPALPVVIDLFVEDAKSYLIMDFVPGQNLKELTNERLEAGLGPWPPATVLRWADDLLAALEYLGSFSPPIVHRDIKPHNLKLTPSGGIVLLDFGLAKGVASDASAEAHSVPGYSLGYAPIEQLRGSGTDVRADLFALGATLVHLMSGTPPPDALSRTDSIVQGRGDPLDRILDALPVPDAVAASLRRTLALSRSDRPHSAAALRAILQLAADGRTDGGSAAETRRGSRVTRVPPAPSAYADSTKAAGSAAPSNLPQPMTGFIGRESETNHLAEIVRASRVVTLTGPGGIGKTRLALRVAEEVADEHPGGVWFVDLSSLPDPALVALTVATAAGIVAPPESPVLDALAAGFAGGPTRPARQLRARTRRLRRARRSSRAHLRGIASHRDEPRTTRHRRRTRLARRTACDRDDRRFGEGHGARGRRSPALRGPRQAVAPVLRSHPPQHGGDSRVVPPPRGHSARHRARRRACERSLGRADPQANRQASERICECRPECAGAPADPRRRYRLELQPARTRRARVARQALAVPVRIRTRRGDGHCRQRGRCPRAAQPSGRQIARERRRAPRRGSLSAARHHPRICGRRSRRFRRRSGGPPGVHRLGASLCGRVRSRVVGAEPGALDRTHRRRARRAPRCALSQPVRAHASG